MGTMYPMRCNVCSGSGMVSGGNHSIIVTTMGWVSDHTLFVTVKKLPTGICADDRIETCLEASLPKETTDNFEARGSATKIRFVKVGAPNTYIEFSISEREWHNSGNRYTLSALVTRTY